MDSKIRQIRAILQVEPADYWGPAAQAALDALIHSTPQGAVNVLVPPPATPIGANVKPQWPKEQDASSFYGVSDGSNRWEDEHLITITSPYLMHMDGTAIIHIRCHKKVATSLLRCLNRIYDLYQHDPAKIAASGLDQYDGCYNFRKIRGSTTHLSMHSYGAAIDFDSAHNNLGALVGHMPREVVAIFKAEGWRWGGDYVGRKDWMHFEACQ